MKVMSYGGGVNSVAMLIGFLERGIKPDVILFADTGGERPETYRHIEFMSGWAVQNGFPEISVCRENKTLEQDCLDRGALPGIAYGFKSCSEHFKIRPQKRWLKKQGIKADLFYVGIDAGESRRVQDDPKTSYPLVDWGWDRDDCVEVIKKAGIASPGKSSCFFCPSMRQTEIREMAVQNPDLMERAIRMERGADLTVIKGLGRRYSWESLIATDDMFPELYLEPEIPCGCYDG